MNKSDNLRPDIDFLFEMGSIQFISRMWKRFLRDDFANLAEHHFRMVWIAMVIASHEKNVDTGKIAKIVKDADNLDVDFELAEQASKGSPLQNNWQEHRLYVAKEKLYTATGKQLFDQLGSANPHDWHVNGRNRRNSGDWQK